MITFTDRELKHAWQNNRTAFESAGTKTNAHRLLLFYAVETGLKAVFLKQNSKLHTNGEFTNVLHNLNKLIDKLNPSPGARLRLSQNICLDVDDQGLPTGQRQESSSKLNGIWRYGAKAKSPTDEQLENQLIAVLEWIEGELR